VAVVAVVVRWRGGDEVRRCLRSLTDRGGPALRKVVLVDSGSGDGGADRLAEEFPTVEVLPLAENRSFAWAAGRGAELGHEPYLLLLNPDTELTVDCLPTLLAELGRRPEATGAVPLLSDADGTLQHRWQLRCLPGPVRLAAGLAGRPVSTDPPTATRPVEQPAAAAWLVRRDVWDALDGLDPAFVPAWWEDVDFCARLRGRLGRPGFPAREGFWVVPGARVLHGGGSSLAQLTDTAFLEAYHRNLLRYAERHHSRRLTFIRAGVRLSVLARALVRPSRRRAYLHTLKALG
jgi:GT2 family glycosyltransferase